MKRISQANSNSMFVRAVRKWMNEVLRTEYEMIRNNFRRYTPRTKSTYRKTNVDRKKTSIRNPLNAYSLFCRIQKANPNLPRGSLQQAWNNLSVKERLRWKSRAAKIPATVTSFQELEKHLEADNANNNICVLTDT